MKYCSAIEKRYEMLPFAATWMDRENIMPSEINYSETNIV